MKTRPFCSLCGSYVQRSQAEHNFSKKHLAALAGPVVRTRSARKVRRAAAYRNARLEPFTLDDPEPTHKVCRGIPSLEVDSHIEPLESFARNRAYPDGYYVRCRSCHRFYHFEYNQRRAAAAAEVA
jgi:hypothetical protein